MPARKQKNPVVKLEQDAVRYAELLLFEGSVFGGRPLATLLKMYETDGPYTPVRNELILHLRRCADALAEMNALIIARAQTVGLPKIKENR